MDTFIGRNNELKKLEQLFDNRSASLVVIKGRRRVGKSRLIEEFGKKYKFYQFMGLNPRKALTAQDQRNEFARQLRGYFDTPQLRADDWGDLFTYLAKQTTKGKVVIAFDEISWMAVDEPDFLGKLKIIWDTLFKKNPKLILIICGSVSSWIEKNICQNTGYFGRPSLNMTLQQLPLDVCNKFWDGYGSNITTYEKLKILAVMGGVPRYLELINPKLSAEENIRKLCFDRDSAIYNEFEKIFTDIYSSRNRIYKPVIESLVDGKLTQEKIAIKLKTEQSGKLTEYLSDLELGGFITRDHTWNIDSGKVSNLSTYRLSDNFIRFSLKYVLPNQLQIEKGFYGAKSLQTLPGWNTIMGLQFECLVLNNHMKIVELCGIQHDEVVFANPFFQRKTARMAGCQVDYLIQTRDTAYLCEIKFNRSEMGINVIKDMQEKLQRIKLPKHMSRRAVLIHANGVKDEVRDALFFSKIIDFGEFLI